MDQKKLNYLDAAALRHVFVCQLSLLYAAKSHLIDSLPALIEQAAFATLKQALNEDMDDSMKQMICLREVLRLLNESPMTENCLGMNTIVKEAYNSVLYLNGKNYESDMSIIFYMGVIEHMQVGAARMLNLIAKNKDYAPYAQLIKETLDMSADNAGLFNVIAKEYIGKN